MLDAACAAVKDWMDAEVAAGVPPMAAIGMFVGKLEALVQ